MGLGITENGNFSKKKSLEQNENIMISDYPKCIIYKFELVLNFTGWSLILNSKRLGGPQQGKNQDLLFDSTALGMSSKHLEMFPGTSGRTSKQSSMTSLLQGPYRKHSYGKTSPKLKSFGYLNNTESLNVSLEL